jgi:flagellar biosynthesis protein FlhF
MQVRVFESPDMASGLKMVRNELGADALILSTRSVRNPRLGILGKSMLEITAAIDEAAPSISSKTSAFSGTSWNSTAPAPLYRTKASNANNTNASPGSRFSLVPSTRHSRSETTSPPPDTQDRATGERGADREIDELKSMIRSLSAEVSRLKPSTHSEDTRHISAEASAGCKQSSQLEQDFPVDMLKGYGICTETATIIADLGRNALSDEERSDPEQLTRFLQEIAAGFIQVSPPDFSAQGPQKRIAFVGPTGVGKTTTLAKIAARCIAQFKKSVALITIDTYRIAAVEQLKVYGEIMGLPVDVVLTPGQLEKALHNHRHKDVILIDTAGRSPKDTVSIEELAAFMPDDLNIEKHLVLSAGTREKELHETVSHFQKLDLDKTIFTKIDECSNLGVILNTQLNNPAPLSYITNGQRVPEDLLAIDRDAVARLVIPSNQECTS